MTVIQDVLVEGGREQARTHGDFLCIYNPTSNFNHLGQGLPQAL